MGKNRPHCYRCIHFYVTWDNNFPSGCRAYGIKSRHLPALEVLRVTGRGCLSFVVKTRVARSDPGLRSSRKTRGKFF